MRVFISARRAEGAQGGGASTFAGSFRRYLRRKGIPTVPHILLSTHALLIAHDADPGSVRLARKFGCIIIHRVDEHLSPEDGSDRVKRHERLREINRYAHMTVFQSEFVCSSLYAYLRPTRFCVIRNGADPGTFYPGRDSDRIYVGHVTHSVGKKKRLDLLEAVIRNHPGLDFLLVGNHAQSALNFAGYPNVRMTGSVSRDKIAAYYRQMKCLYFPSENDPCPNTAVEAVLSGVPVCYHPVGGTVEIVRDCGLPLDHFDEFLAHLEIYRTRCLNRPDLHFSRVGERYFSLFSESYD